MASETTSIEPVAERRQAWPDARDRGVDRIPAADVAHSARFYERVFGWTVYPDPRVPGYERFLDRQGAPGGCVHDQG